MKTINHLFNIGLISLISMPNSSYAEQVSINIHSFLPFGIDQIYLGAHPFTVTMINEITMPAGKYPIFVRSFRNQEKINTRHFITVPISKDSNKKVKLSLVFMPDGSVIDDSNLTPKSPADLPSNKFESLAKKQIRDIQRQLVERDQIQLIIPDIDTDYITEHEKNYDWYSTMNADPTTCTGTFKVRDGDVLPYITSNNDSIIFKYRQNGKIKQVYFDQTINDKNTSLLNRRIRYSSSFKDGIKFNLLIVPKEKLKNIASMENLNHYKVSVKLEMHTQKQKYTILNRPMYFQEYCAFANSSLIYYKPISTRFIDAITPDVDWR